MNLIVETKNEAREGDVINAYNEAMNESTIENFMNSLKNNIGTSEIGKGGNHIWIHDSVTNERLAIITNLLN